jgi:hypothetical protein
VKKLSLVALVSVLALALNVIPASAESETVPLHNTSLTGGSCGLGPNPGSVPTPNSFVMLNTAGQPGTANKVIANIQLKDGAANTTYDIFVYGPANCGSPVPNGGTLTTDGNGHGHSNVHLNDIDAAGGPHEFFVQLNARVGGAPGPFPAEFTSEIATLD